MPIKEIGWDGTYVLTRQDGTPVSKGDEIKPGLFAEWGQAPHKPEASGRIWIKDALGVYRCGGYVFCYGLSWVKAACRQ